MVLAPRVAMDRLETFARKNLRASIKYIIKNEGLTQAMLNADIVRINNGYITGSRGLAGSM